MGGNRMINLLRGGLEHKLSDKIATGVIEKYVKMAHEEIKATVMSEIEKYAIEDIKTLRDNLKMSEQVILTIQKNDEIVSETEVGHNG